MNFTFEQDDILKRKGYAEKLSKLIANGKSYADTSSLVLAIDSEWGTGKSTFLAKWSDMLQNKLGHESFIYNAWEHDDFGNPLLSIMYTLMDAFTKKNITIKSRDLILSKTAQISKLIAQNVGKKIIVDKIGIEIDKIGEILKKSTDTDPSDFLELLKTQESNKSFKDFEQYKKIKKELKKLIEEISVEKKFIFIIDELDRCRPLYAIETLEAIKHYFNLNNVTFVFALDIKQLSHSIATVYGQDMDANGYLRRFFDIQLRIPKPTMNDYVKFVNMNLEIKKDSDMISKWTNIFSRFNCSLRDIDKVMFNMKLLIDTSFSKYCSNDVIEIYTYLSMLKHKHPTTYDLVINKRFLSSKDSSSGTYETLPDLFFDASNTIKEFHHSINNEQNQHKIYDRFNNKRIAISQYDDHANFSIDYGTVKDNLKILNFNTFMDPFDFQKNLISRDLTISQYIERKMEFFEIISD